MDPDYLLDLFAQFGSIRLKRMFGGKGLFADEVMFGYLDGDVIYLKTDEETRAAFVAEGCEALAYQKRTGETIELSFYRVPDRLYDDPGEMAEWARRAEAVAQRSPAAVRKRQRASASRSRASRRPANTAR